VVTDNGAGDYFAGPGQNCGIATDPINCPVDSFNVPRPQGALWTFGLYINVAGGTNLSDYNFTLYYDFDPGPGTFIMDLGTIDLDLAIECGDGNCGDNDLAGMTLFQDSQNLLFAGFSTAVPFIVDLPTYGPFDPDALGEYFLFIGFQKKLVPAFAGVVGIDVNVVPVPAAVWLLGSALGVLGWLRRRSLA
jgi:hypothetical protein